MVRIYFFLESSLNMSSLPVIQASTLHIQNELKTIMTPILQ